jgi:hypothetical protein
MLKKGASPEQQEKVDYAYNLSHDENFIYVLEAENGLWDENRTSVLSGPHGERDRGLCQVNSYWHSAITKSRNFSNWKWQINECLSLFRSHTRFYGQDHIQEAKKNFEVVYN